MVHNLEVKGNIFLLVKESWLQTSWWHTKTNKKPIILENDYTTVVTTSVKTVTRFFPVAKNVCSIFDFKQHSKSSASFVSLESFCNSETGLLKGAWHSQVFDSTLQERPTKEITEIRKVFC